MVVEKQVTSHVRTAIEIKEITLLSVEEYMTANYNIPLLNDWWWLRSPGDYSIRVARVAPDGGVDVHGSGVISDYVGVRPAIRINPRSIDLQIGEKIRLGGFIWTHVAEGTLLCDEIICKMPFRKHWWVDDTNDYEKSDIKVYLNEWFKRYIQEEQTGAAENEK